MAATLRETLLAPQIRPQVLADCQALIEQELDDKPGLSAGAVKLAYKAVAGFAPGYYQGRIRKMLPEMADRLEPYWADFRTAGGSSFGDYLAKRGGEVSEALLSVTDGMAERGERPAIVKAYRSVRPSAARHVEAALPRLGEMVSKYAG